VKRTALLDTGPLVALLDRRDQNHPWVVNQMARLRRPLHTCEAVIAEAFHLLRHLPPGRTAILEMLAEGVLTIPLQLREQPREVLALLQRYANVPMALADACLVRLSELVSDGVLFTLDSDFRIYRRHGRQKIPLVIPPDR
jgi:predicted nucleic acid-binding protein